MILYHCDGCGTQAPAKRDGSKPDDWLIGKDRNIRDQHVCSTACGQKVVARYQADLTLSHKLSQEDYRPDFKFALIDVLKEGPSEEVFPSPASPLDV